MEHGTVNSTARFATMAPLDLFVDGDNGNDANVGTTQATALATWAEAERRIPFVVNHLVRVHFATAAAGYVATTLRARVLNQPVIFFADDVWDPGVYSDVAAGTCDAGTDATQIVDTVGGHAVNTFRNGWLTLDDGAAANYRKLVKNNSADTIFSASAFGAAPAQGDSWRVFVNVIDVSLDTLPTANDNAFILTAACAATRTQPFAQASGPGRYVIIGFNFVSADEAARQVVLGGEPAIYGCDIEAQRLVVPTGSQAYMGFDRDNNLAPFSLIPFTHLGAGFNCPAIDAWGGWGCVLGDTGNDLLRVLTWQSTLIGYWNVTGTLGGACTMTLFSREGVVSHYGGSCANINLGGAFPHAGNFVMGYLSGNIGPLYQAGDGVFPIDVGLGTPSGSRGSFQLINGEIIGTDSGIRFRGLVEVALYQTITGQATTNDSILVSGGARCELVGPPAYGRAAPDTDWNVNNGAPQDRSFFASSGDAMINLNQLSIIIRSN